MRGSAATTLLPRSLMSSARDRGGQEARAAKSQSSSRALVSMAVLRAHLASLNAHFDAQDEPCLRYAAEPRDTPAPPSATACRLTMLRWLHARAMCCL